jgi:hypothetical protein
LLLWDAQDTTDAVEIAMGQILLALPRCERELMQVEGEVTALQQDFDRIVVQSARIEAEAAVLGRAQAVDGERVAMVRLKSAFVCIAERERACGGIGGGQ